MGGTPPSGVRQKDTPSSASKTAFGTGTSKLGRMENGVAEFDALAAAPMEFACEPRAVPGGPKVCAMDPLRN